MKNIAENGNGKSHWLEEESARLALSAFERRFGKKHVILACHAALPLLLTPELVNLIRLNFTEKLEIPWIAEADILLSSLCMPMGDGAYEMEPRIRDLLLKRLEALFGKKRTEQLALFLLAWLKHRHTVKTRADTAESHRWIAMAYVDPPQLIDELEARLDKARAGGGAMGVHRIEQIRLCNLAEIISRPMLASGEKERFKKWRDKLAPDKPEPGKKTRGRGDGGPKQGDIVEVAVGKGVAPMKFVFIPPGEFVMGSPEDEPGRWDDEEQQRVRLIKGFYMQTTPVTRGQWRTFAMGTHPKDDFEDDWDCEGMAEPEFDQEEDHPVCCVSWNEVRAFIEWLNRKEGAVSYDLPTEAQWEYACRAGTQTAWFFGSDEKDLERYAWFEKNSGGRTRPVGKLGANPWGLHDMHGNVWEWCLDHCDYDEKSDRIVTDTYREGIKDPVCRKGSRRVVRGGSWGLSPRLCRAANRYDAPPGYRDAHLGFRLVLLPGRLAS